MSVKVLHYNLKFAHLVLIKKVSLVPA